MSNPADSQVGNVDGSAASSQALCVRFNAANKYLVHPLASLAVANLSEKLSAHYPDSFKPSLIHQSPSGKESLIQSLRRISLSAHRIVVRSFFVFSSCNCDWIK